MAGRGRLYDLIRRIEAEGAAAITPELVAGLSLEEQVALTEIMTSVDAERLQESFRDFIPAAFHVLEPETVFQPNWHLDAIADHLMAITVGSLLKLIINIPPRHMKSLEASVLWPAWEWTRTPSLKYLCASYGQDLALRDAVKMRRLVESPWYASRWARVAIASDQHAKDFFENTLGGSRSSAGVGGALPGRGGDRLIVDDAHKTQEAESDLMRTSVLDWWSSTMISRVQDPKTAAKVIIGQRIHERDLPGALLEQGGWTHLNLPAEYEVKPFIYVNAVAPRTKDPRKTDGELLWPARFGPEEIAEMKTMGTYVYSAQFQQRPSPAGGGLLKREWWKFYDVPPEAVGCELEIQSWDLAFKGAATSDRVAGHVWGRRGASVYLLDRVNAPLDFPASCRAIETLSAKWPQATAKYVEDKANGPAAIAELRHRVPGLIPVEPRGSKEARVAAASPYVEAGNVYLPSPRFAPWVEDFIAECAAFPKGAHDDDVDAFTQAIDRLMTMQGFDFLAYARLELEAAQTLEPPLPVGAVHYPPPAPNSSTMKVFSPRVLPNAAELAVLNR